MYAILDDSTTNVTEPTVTNKRSNTMEQFNDIFDIIDDTNDPLEYTNDELNKYFVNGRLEVAINEEEMNNSNKFDHDDNDIIEEEVILSQKFSQLSTKDEEQEQTSTTNKRQGSDETFDETNSSKKRKLTENDLDGETSTIDSLETPAYLSTKNKSFCMLTQDICETKDSITIHDIQELARFMHHIGVLHLRKEILTACLHAIKGTLKEPEDDLIDVDRRILSMQMKALMMGKQQTTTTTAMETDMEDQYVTYENLVYRNLQEIDEKVEKYQEYIGQLKNSLNEYSSEIEQMIQFYVQKHGIKPRKAQNELRLTLINHEFDAEILKRKYFQEDPNEYQIEMAKRLSNAKNEQEKAKRELFELKYRVFFNKPSPSWDSIQTSSSSSSSSSNDNIEQQSFHTYEKLIQKKKTDHIALKILEAEAKFDRCRKLFDSTLSEMWKNHRNLTRNQGMTTTLVNLLGKRFQNITNRWRDIYNYRLHYFFRNSYGETDEKDIDQHQQTMKRIGFVSSLIIDTQHSLTDKQIQLLNRGPSYVPPCQLLTSISSQSMEELAKKEYAPLKHQLNKLFTKHHLHLALSLEIQQQISDKFISLFSFPIPDSLRQRALYEKHLVQSIRNSLKQNNLILRRTADNKNTFYLGNQHDFTTKANEVLNNTDRYKILLSKANGEDNQKWLDEFKEMIESFNFLLETLKQRKDISKDLYNQLAADPKKVILPQIDFLPDVSKENEVLLIPRIILQHSTTWKISKYLNELLEEIVKQSLKPTTIRDEVDFMQKLNHYGSNEKQFRKTTLFCTIEISNYHSLDMHPNMIKKVGYFLEENLKSDRLEHLTIQTIKNLIYLFLYNNFFVYNGKVYTYVKGSPNTVPLSNTLSNMYLSVWETPLLERLKFFNEFYGRYNDQIFFTWNESNEDDLHTFLHSIRDQNPNVLFRKFIGTTVSFLNIYIENFDGKLSTRIYHHRSLQKYTLPYVFQHSKLAHSDWLRSALIRTACICSCVEDFHLERIYLELAYLINGYSLEFIESHVQHFFNYFHTQNMRYSKDQTKYDKFRHECFDYMAMQHELSDELQSVHDAGHLIHFNYLYELGPRCEFSQHFYRIWYKYFNRHPHLSREKSTIQLTTRNQYTLNTLLTYEKPAPPILQ